MQIFNGLEDLTKGNKGVVLTIGNFDGLHLGHQKLIGEVVNYGQEHDLTTALLTFSPHPATVLSDNYQEKRLQSESEFLQKLNSLYLDQLVVHPFTKDFAKHSAESFISLILSYMNLKCLIIGYDFKFGNNKQGDFDFLKKMGEEKGFSVIQVSELTLENKTVSSSNIRNFLGLGELPKAKTMLGENFTAKGVVVHGENKGASLGFPTINVKTEKELFLPKGVYATKVKIKAEVIEGVANFGVAPSIKNEKQPVLEVHLLNFDQDVYGKPVVVEFVQFVRPEKKFANIDALKKQIQDDILFVRKNT